MNKKIALPVLLFLFCIGSHYVAAQQTTNTKSGSQNRTTSNFYFINLKMSGTLYVSQSDHFSLVVEAPAEIIDKITTEVTENTLVIENRNKYITTNSPVVKIYVSMPRPNGLEVNGSGTITALTDFTTNFLSASVAGSGRINLMEVAAEKLAIRIDGSGQIDQAKTTAESAMIELHGSGSYDGENFTCRLLTVSLDGSGDIQLSDIAAGKLWMQNSGSGSIRHVSGLATEALLENTGSGAISAAALNGGTISASNTGSGDIQVGISETLNAQLSGSGSIRYHGMPKTMRKDVSGSGRVTQQ